MARHCVAKCRPGVGVGGFHGHGHGVAPPARPATDRKRATVCVPIYLWKMQCATS
jgi:hypothetical protein